MLLSQNDVYRQCPSTAERRHRERRIPGKQHCDGSDKASPQTDVLLNGIEKRERGEPQRESQRNRQRAGGGCAAAAQGADLTVRLYTARFYSLDR